MRSGGISWYRQSRLTVWGNQAFNRNSIFHRRPQTPLNNMPWDRYSRYYNAGLIDQGVRYGARWFQGLFLEGNKLPFNLAVKGVLGKSNFNRSFLETNDNFTSCFQIKYMPNADTHLSYNVMASRADVDSLSSAQRRYTIHTICTCGSPNLITSNYKKIGCITSRNKPSYIKHQSLISPCF